jgi:hypothetical protein
LEGQGCQQNAGKTQPETAHNTYRANHAFGLSGSITDLNARPYRLRWKRRLRIVSKDWENLA